MPDRRTIHNIIILGALLTGLTAPCIALADEWHDAIRSNELSTIRLLYKQQSDIDHPNEHGKTALMAAAAAGDDALVKTLLEEGADPAATNNLGGTVLMYAIGGGSLTAVEQVLEAGVPLDGQASNGWSAMMMAAAKNEGRMVALLGRAGANPNTEDIYGWTPLMRAVYENNQSAASALLSLSGIEANRLNRNEQNALHLAVIAGHTNMVEMLLAHDIEQTIDANQHSPQTIARELGRDDLLNLLMDQE